MARSPGEGAPIVVLGHYDTVWPVGQLARMPIRREAGRLYGPGTYDMKAGIVIAILPLIIIYPFMQRYFVKGITLGSVKE